ncbi:unnamed protein product [Phytophthora fragariaefolia]|uniref:Unnamed protein product n=1 Tax=Phytophthora fragariaefolia TaxID=1490495 RepID=A0A9W6X9B1_9STRA|nr:unnamed protein product [Phytophthora fragariaefolia]
MFSSPRTNTSSRATKTIHSRREIRHPPQTLHTLHVSHFNPELALLIQLITIRDIQLPAPSQKILERIVSLSSISERSVGFDEAAGGISEAKDEEVNEYEASEADGYVLNDDLDASDEARVSAGRSGAPRPITRNLAGEFDEVAKPEPARDDSGSKNEISDKKPADETVIRKLPGNRSPMNSSTPAASRVIGRILDQLMESSDWIRQFSGELAWSVNTMSAVKVAEDTVSLLRAKGLEPQTNPSEAALRDWPPAIVGKELKRWKGKLRLSFGTSDIGLKTPPTVRPKGDADPLQIPLPQTPKKNEH